MYKPVFLMGTPKNGFTIDTPINAKMLAGAEICRRDPAKFSQHALDMHGLLKFLLKEQHLSILDIEPTYGGSDSIFVRDEFCLVDETTVVLAKFASETRRAEIENIRPILDSKYVVNLQNPKAILEGGDFLPTPFNMSFIGYGPRTNFAAIEELQGLFPRKNFVPLELKSGHYDGTQDSLVAAEFIHADTAACFLPRGDLIIYRDAFTEASWKKAEEIVRDNGGKVYSLSSDEADYLSTNIKAIGPETLVVPTGEYELYLWTWLRDLGYKTFCFNFDHFALADGGPHCLIHEVPEYMLTPIAREMLSKQTPAWAKPRGFEAA